MAVGTASMVKSGAACEATPHLHPVTHEGASNRSCLDRCGHVSHSSGQCTPQQHQHPAGVFRRGFNAVTLREADLYTALHAHRLRPQRVPTIASCFGILARVRC